MDGLLFAIISPGREGTILRIEPMGQSPVPPGIALIDGDGDSAMLFRYAADGAFAGDTWHAGVEQAKQQARDEYGDGLSAWDPVPAAEFDVHGFVRRTAAERLNPDRHS